MARGTKLQRRNCLLTARPERFRKSPATRMILASLDPNTSTEKAGTESDSPSFQIMQFVNNSTPRPDPSVVWRAVQISTERRRTTRRGAKLLGAIDSYLVLHNWQGKGYYYVQNEPQNQTDYDLAAYLANLTKTAAPNLRIAVSEEPKPGSRKIPKPTAKATTSGWRICRRSKPTTQSCGKPKGKTSGGTFCTAIFRPTSIRSQSITAESKRGFLSGGVALPNFWFCVLFDDGLGIGPYNNPRPMGTAQNGDGFLLYPPVSGELVSSIRWELLREGTEDFEYFLLANGGSMPKTPDLAAVVDTTVGSAVTSPTAYTRDTSALQDLRNQLGLKIEGKANGWPVLMSKPIGAHPRASYFLNFKIQPVIRKQVR